MSTIDVEALLGEIGKSRAERESSSTATAFNLIAFVENDTALVKLILTRIEQIEARNPSRTILLSSEEKQSSVNGESIRLPIRDLAAPQLASIVRGLTVPTVHTVLMWAGSRVLDPRFTALADLADVVIVFSSVRSTGTQMLADVVSLRGTPIEPKIRDLAFLRLYAWQDMIAGFFDDDELMDELPHIKEIVVRSGSAPEAYYLVGWLASRLQWQPCGKNEFCNADGNNIAIDVREEGEPRRVYGVQLTSANCVFGAAMQDDAHEIVCLTVEGKKARPQSCVPIHDIDMVSLIERAIFMKPGEGIYLETLEMVGRLLEHLQ